MREIKRSNQLAWMALGFLVLSSTACQSDKGAAKVVGATSSKVEAQVIEASMSLGELEKKIVRFAPTRLEFSSKGLTGEQVEAVELLVQAALVLDEIFWAQASPVGPELMARLRQPKNAMEKQLAKYMKINYGPYSRLDDFSPFIKGVPEKPEGANYYPTDMSKEEFETHIKTHPEDRVAFLSNFTVIVRDEKGKLKALPYALHYKSQLDRAAGFMRQAAEKVGNESLAKYLRSRADAFGSNDYFASDVDWMDVVDSPLEVTIGPYEVYEDRLFAYKAAFESFITLRDPEESAKLAKVAGFLDELEKALPIPEEYKNFERGKSSPIMVVDLIHSAGDTRAGVQTLAFNLPNDERVREQKGCKKVLFKNVSHAKFDQILKPIAEKILAADQLDRLDFDAYFNHTLMHEMSHGLGPGFIKVGKERKPVSQLLKDRYVAIEEAKADTLGMFTTLYLVKKGVLPKDLDRTCLVTFLAGIFRSVRFGVHEAHGQANLIIFNYLLDGGAYTYDKQSQRFAVDLAKAPEVIGKLAHDLLMVQAEGSYEGAGKLIERYGKPKPEMLDRLTSLSSIPVDIFPEFEIEAGQQ